MKFVVIILIVVLCCVSTVTSADVYFGIDIYSDSACTVGTGIPFMPYIDECWRAPNVGYVKYTQATSTYVRQCTSATDLVNFMSCSTRLPPTCTDILYGVCMASPFVSNEWVKFKRITQNIAATPPTHYTHIGERGCDPLLVKGKLPSTYRVNSYNNWDRRYLYAITDLSGSFPPTGPCATAKCRLNNDICNAWKSSVNNNILHVCPKSQRPLDSNCNFVPSTSCANTSLVSFKCVNVVAHPFVSNGIFSLILPNPQRGVTSGASITPFVAIHTVFFGCILWLGVLGM